MIKKHYLLIALLMAMMPMVTWAQEDETMELTVANGVLLTDYHYGYNFLEEAMNVSQTQMVYPAAMLETMVGSQITKIVFYVEEYYDSVLTGFTMKLKEVSENVAGPNGLETAGSTVVYEGSLHCDGATVVFDFDTPYEYGGGNLLVTVETDGTSNWYFAAPAFRGISRTNGMYTYREYVSIWWGTFIDEQSEDILPKLTFGYENVEGACPRVENLTATAHANSIDLSWDATDDAVEYVIYVNDAVFDSTPDNEYSIEDLEPATHYSIAVVTKCDDNLSFARTVDVMTSCELVAMPWIPTFEEINPLHCWTIIDNNGDNHSWTVVTNSSANYLNAASGASSDDWAISPEIVLPADADEPLLQWQDYLQTFMVNGSYEVWVAPNGGNTIGDFTDMVFSVTGTSTTANLYYWRDVDLSAYAGMTIRIAFRHYVSDDDNGIRIRNIMLRSNEQPEVRLDGREVVTMGGTYKYVASLEDGASTGIEYTWTSSMGADGMATLVATDDTLRITYSNLAGYDTITLVASNDYGADTVKMVVRVVDLAPVSTFPYATGFEAGDDNDNWYIVNATNGWAIGNAVSKTGSKGLYVSKDGGVTYGYDSVAPGVSFAARAMVLDDTTTYVLKCDWKGVGEAALDFARVFLMPMTMDLYNLTDINLYSSSNLPTGVIAIDGGDVLSDAEDWSVLNQTFAVPEAGTYMLVICWRNDDSYGGTAAAFDNVIVRHITCMNTSELEVTEISHDGAAISWIPSGSESQWEVTIDGVPQVVTNTLVIPTGLDGNTTHTVSVRAICGAGDTSLAQVATFHTLCEPIEVPFYESFDDYTTTLYAVDIDCWAHVGDGSLSISEDNALVGKSLRFTTNNQTGRNIAVLPAFTLPTDMLKLSFMSKPESPSMSGKLSVGYITDLDDTNTYVELFGQTAGEASLAFQQIVTTFETAPADAHIAISYIPLEGQLNYFWFIDELEVTLGVDTMPQVCDVPTDLVCIDTGTHSISIAWTSEAVSWKVLVNHEIELTTVANPCSIGGLDENTTYYISVAAVCENGLESEYCMPIAVKTKKEEVPDFPDIPDDPQGIDGVAYSTMSLYPNPASTTVKVSGIEVGAEVTIVDVNGRMVRSTTAQSETIELNVEGLAAGTYFVRLAGAEGTAMRRLVVR